LSKKIKNSVIQKNIDVIWLHFQKNRGLREFTKYEKVKNETGGNNNSKDTTLNKPQKVNLALYC
jgi:hypothetical protein